MEDNYADNFLEDPGSRTSPAPAFLVRNPVTLPVPDYMEETK